jgi:hypothetical protein
VCMCACLFLSEFCIFLCFWGETKTIIILSQFSWANKISQNFLALLLLRFYYFWMSSSTYFFGFVCFASSNPCMKLGMRLGTVLLLPITNLHGLSESFSPGLSACSLFVLFVHLLFGSFENGLLCAGSANFFALFVTGLMSMHFVQLVQCWYVMPHYTWLGMFVFVRYGDMCILCAVYVYHMHISILALPWH